MAAINRGTCAVLALSTLAAAVSVARADPIWVTRSDQPGTHVEKASGAPISIDVGTLTSTLTVVIFDNDATPATSNVGQVTITGTTAGGELRLIVAKNLTDDQLPGAPRSLATAGVANFGTSTSAGITVSSDSLRDRTRVLIAAVGDITGDIDIGEAYRLQAGGNITANITAHTVDGTFGFSAISFVTAGNAITGNITATGVPAGEFTAPQLGSIDTVIISGSTGDGLTGNIRAPLGKIEEIFCASKIGTPQQPVQIAAGYRVGRISMRSGIGATLSTRPVIGGWHRPR